MRDKAIHAEREKFRCRGIVLWEKVHGPIPRDSKGRKYQIHHKDRNWRNTGIDNLECVSREKHEEIHYDERVCTIKTHLGGRGFGNQHGKGNRGKIRSKETRQKIAAKKLGVKMPEETKRKIAIATIGKNKGRKKSPEEIARREASKAARRQLDPSYGQVR